MDWLDTWVKLKIDDKYVTAPFGGTPEDSGWGGKILPVGGAASRVSTHLLDVEGVVA